MMMNDGRGPNGRVLQAETVAQMSQDGLRVMNLAVGSWPTAIPSLTNEGEFFPGLSKGWAHTFMTNREDAPTGRPKDSLMWAGLANCYYWIDRKTGVGGSWAPHVLRLQDIAPHPA